MSTYYMKLVLRNHKNNHTGLLRERHDISYIIEGDTHARGRYDISYIIEGDTRPGDARSYYTPSALARPSIA